MLFLIIAFGMFLIIISRGGSAAFGKGIGSLMAIAFIGFLVIFGGGAIILFLLPFITAVLFPLVLVGGALMLIGMFIRMLTGGSRA